MRSNRLTKRIAGVVLAAAVAFTAVSAVPVYAEENVEGEAAAEGAVEGAESSEEVDAADLPVAEDGAAAGGDMVSPGNIIANNGMYIANSFPDSYLPSGFRKQTVAYQGQNIELAYMDASNGAVTLAYLTDASGSFGDFYLCDTATATMSDYVRFEGGNDRFLIVLAPGTVTVPDGFVPASLTVNGKSVSAWVYSDSAPASDSKDDGDDDKGGLFGFLGSIGTVKVYAGELDLGVGAGDAGAGAGAGTAAPVVDAAPVDPAAGGDVAAPADPASGADAATPADTAAVTDTNAADQTSGTPAAENSVSDYFLVYGMDQAGNQGFYLFDSVGQTYQRYVALGAGESDELVAAKKSARTRLFIIAALAVLSLILLIIVINMALSGRRNDDDYYDYDDDYEAMKKRVEKKSKRTPSPKRKDDYDDYDDYEDDEYEDEEEDVKVYSKKPARTSRRSAEDDWEAEEDLQPRPARKAPSQDIDLDDDFSFDFIKK